MTLPNVKVLMVSVNNTQNPRTGGEYVYKVIKHELLRHKYAVNEVSVPILLNSIIKNKGGGRRKEDFYRLMLHIQCVFYSFFKRLGQNIIITSSHPAFPVFGHLIYHQPKAGTGIKSLKGFLEAYRRVGCEFVENEWLSPVWLIAKRSHILHLSNSFFTKKLIRKLYGLDSIVLYPPVLIKPYMKIDLKRKRKHSVLISKPEVLSGITMLPQILRNMPKSLSFLIIGMADSTGLSIIQALKKEGFNMKYLGYVSVKEKVKLMQTCSHYLHLGLNEPFGMTVVEAMAAGCIPIAPESGGIPEYLPKCLLYSSPNEASEKILSKTGIDNLELKLELRRIATSFSEKIFRVKFLRYFERLVNSLKKGD